MCGLPFYSPLESTWVNNASFKLYSFIINTCKGNVKSERSCICVIGDVDFVSFTLLPFYFETALTVHWFHFVCYIQIYEFHIGVSQHHMK